MKLQELFLNHNKYEEDLGLKECVSWIINLDDFNEDIDEIYKYMSDKEIIKAQSIKFQNKKKLFCLRKAVLRIILSTVLNENPRLIHIYYDSNRKPYIDNKDIFFNISHSKNYLYIGISYSNLIGVDIEMINPKRGYSFISKSIFSKEEDKVFLTYTEKKKILSFFKAWVQKEAVSKAAGKGISIGMNKIPVHIDADCIYEKYSTAFNELNYNVDISVKYKEEYFLAAAIIKTKI